MVLRLVDIPRKEFVGAFKFSTDPTGDISDTQKGVNDIHYDTFAEIDLSAADFQVFEVHKIKKEL
jgi:hypothetical protein